MEDETLTTIPEEVLEIILTDPSITFEDLKNLRLCCSYLNKLILSKALLWKNKLFTNWSFLKPEYDKLDICDWYLQCKHILETKKYIHKNIMEMSSKYRWRVVPLHEVDCEQYKEKAKENEGLCRLYMQHFLREIFNMPVISTGDTPHNGIDNLTNKYYAKFVYEYLVQRCSLKDIWYNMVRSGKPYTPDVICKFAFKWIYPLNDYCVSMFQHKIDNLVQVVLADLPPDHPLQCGREVKEEWKHSILTDNQHSGEDSRTILTSLSRCLFENCCINLQNPNELRDLGLDEIVSFEEPFNTLKNIIFETAARHCGVKLLIKGSSGHQFIYWKEKWLDRTPRFILEPEHNSMRPSTGRCPFSQNRMGPPIDIDESFNLNELILNMLPPLYDRNVDYTNSAFVNMIELAYLVAPYNADIELANSIMCDVQNIPFSEMKLRKLETHLSSPNLRPDMKNILGEIYNRAIRALDSQRRDAGNEEKTYKIPKKHRTSDIKFAIGLICTHKTIGYKCVIAGWDYKCEASKEWQRSMLVDQLEQGAEQPFYSVIAEDQSSRYAAQENLIFMKKTHRMQSIEPKIQLDFSHFNGKIYVPNTEKLQEYPDDLQHIQFYVNKMH